MVANGDVFVLAQASANATILAQADQTNGAGWFNGDDAVVLRKGTTIVDVIGQVGVDPGTEWGAGADSTADNTLRRKAGVDRRRHQRRRRVRPGRRMGRLCDRHVRRAGRRGAAAAPRRPRAFREIQGAAHILAEERPECSAACPASSPPCAPNGFYMQDPAAGRRPGDLGGHLRFHRLRPRRSPSATRSR